jgi:hypothetical protein
MAPRLHEPGVVNPRVASWRSWKPPASTSAIPNSWSLVPNGDTIDTAAACVSYLLNYFSRYGTPVGDGDRVREPSDVSHTRQIREDCRKERAAGELLRT